MLQVPSNRRRGKLKPLMVILALFTLSVMDTVALPGQPSGSVLMRVTYVTSRQVYLDAGAEEGVAIGDTVTLSRSGAMVGQAVISATASHSAVGHILGPETSPKIGDLGNITKGSESLLPNPPGVAQPLPEIASQPRPLVETVPTENILSGRIGLQYSGEWAEDSRLNIGQPAAAAYLHMRNILGTGMALSFSGREYYELTGAYARYGDSVRSRFDLYQFQLERDRPGDWFGFSAGRMVSQYVSGLGTFDGGQVFLRQGAFTSGVLIGKGIQGRALGIGGDDTKEAVFAGFRTGDPALWNYQGTVAYARQEVNGNLDRSFLYVQSSASLGNSLWMFGNAQLDLNDVNNGQRVSTLRLSNALLSINYSPDRLLSASLGYDGTRSVYLFETMKNIPDSLFRESLRHGFHARATLRPLPGISVTAAATFQTRRGDARNSHTFSGMVRFTNIFGTGLHVGARYAAITGVYLDGSDITYELERLLFTQIDLLLRYDDYAYSLTTISHAYRTKTASAMLNWRISRRFYSTAGGDYTIDDSMNSARVFMEVGMWF